MDKDSDTRNVQDRYKGWMTELIAQDVQSKTFPFAVLMENISGDFNLGCVMRSGNGFGARELFYLGRKQWDRRSSLGTQNYSLIKHLATHQDLAALKDRYTLVAAENVGRTIPLQEFDWNLELPPLILIGEEGRGLSQESLELADYRVEIGMIGSVRSFNAAVAASIIMWECHKHYLGKTDECRK